MIAALVASFAIGAAVVHPAGAQGGIGDTTGLEARVPGHVPALPVIATSIRDAHTMLDSVRVVRVAGRAVVGSLVMHARALDVAIDDGTAAIRVFRRQLDALEVHEGDSVEVTGVVKRYRGGLELEATSVRVVAGTPRLVSARLLPGALVDAQDEGRLVRVRGTAGAAGRSEGGWWLTVLADSAPGARRDSITLWVGAAHAMPPNITRVHAGDRVDVTGILSAFQDNPSEPVVWQVLPRGQADVRILGVPAWVQRRIVQGLAALALLAMLLVVVARLFERRQRRALRALEDRYQQLLALSPEAVIVHGDGIIRFANPAAARLLGAAGPEALVGQPIARHWPDGPDGPDASHGQEAAAARMRTRLLTTDGEAIDVEAAASPCRFADQPATVVLARDVRAQLRHERELRALAQLDELTGLFNRRGFQLHAETMRREHAQADRPLALVLADLDGLKAINDTLGHPAGDAAIRAVADALRATLGDDALVARWGGDEFAAIVALPVGSSGAAGIADAVVALDTRLQRALECVPAAVGTVRVEARASLGVAPLPPGGASATAETLGEVDEKLYARKRERRRHLVA